MNHKAAGTFVIKIGSKGQRQNMDQKPKTQFYQPAAWLQRSHLTHHRPIPVFAFLAV